MLWEPEMRTHGSVIICNLQSAAESVGCSSHDRAADVKFDEFYSPS